MSPKITEQMSVPEILRQFPETRGIFLHYGLPVDDYKATTYENLFATCLVHQIDLLRLLTDLNRAVGV